MRVILDNIRSKYNVGSIFRTADGAGCEKLYLSGYSPCPIDEKGEVNNGLIKVSLGAEDYLDWEDVQIPTVELIKKLKADGFKIYALEQDEKSVEYSEVSLREDEWSKAVLILGNEVDGLDREVLDLVDQTLEVTMYGAKTSLNVSVVFGVVIYNLRGF